MPKVVTLFTLSLILARAAYADEVQILVVGDGKPYLEAARAAAAGVGKGAEPVVLPVDAPLPPRWQTDVPPVIIAVGARAVRLALTLPDAKVVAAMVLQESPELQSPRVHSVPLSVPVERQLDLLARLAPGARKVGLVVDPTHSGAVVAEARAATARRNLELVLREVQDPAQAPAAFDGLLPKVDALLLVADTTVVKRDALELLVTRSLALKRPVIGYSVAVVQSGLLAGYAVDAEENGLAAAAIARALVAGEKPKPAELAGQLHLNLKSARALGLAVPAELAAPPTRLYDPR